MPRTLTLAELTEAIAEGNRVAWRRAGIPGDAQTPKAELRDLLMRRVRHWTVAGMLPTINRPHGGTGRRRLYGEECVYLVAVLRYLADWGLPIGGLKAVADTILEAEVYNRPEWRDAIRGQTQFYLAINPYSPADQPQLNGLVLELLSEPAMIERLKRVQAGMHLNLTKIFADVIL